MSNKNWEDRISKLEEFSKNSKLIFSNRSVKRIINDMRALWDELQAARQGGEVEPVGFVQSNGMRSLRQGHPAKIYPKGVAASPFESRTFVYTRPPAPTQGVPEEPTEEMLEAAMSERDKQHPANAKRYLRYVWERMYAAVPNHPSGEWVRCDERLPKLTGNYCIAIADPDDIGWSSSVSWTAFCSGECWEDCDPVEDGQPVTHWQPMPQPPKDKQEGE